MKFCFAKISLFVLQMKEELLLYEENRDENLFLPIDIIFAANTTEPSEAALSLNHVRLVAYGWCDELCQHDPH